MAPRGAFFLTKNRSRLTGTDNEHCISFRVNPLVSIGVLKITTPPIETNFNIHLKNK